MNFSNIVNFVYREPAGEREVEEAEQAAGKRFPSEYVRFLKTTNGFTSDEAHLYSTEILAERNSTYEIGEYCPEYLCIGDDGGGNAFLVRFDEKNSIVYMVGHGALDPRWGFFKEVGSSLQSWFELGCPLE